MSAEDAINSLLDIHPKGFDLSLDRVTRLLDRLGNPQDRIPPVFHVAGTNGKGSVTAFLRAMLEASGRTVHVHTSPHLVNWCERYRLGAPGGGRFVSDPLLEDAVERAASANGGEPITVFEIMSAVGFLLFSEHEADYTILEVGLGGRFDATNVIAAPLVSVITPIALDHQSYLGDTLAAIAFEKAGIIKQDCPVVIGPQEDAALGVLVSQAQRMAAPATIARQDYDWYPQAGRWVFQDDQGLLDLPLPRLAGEFQLSNASTAMAACRRILPDLEDAIFDRAMTSVSWPGRLERLPEGRLHSLAAVYADDNRLEIKPDIWIDGGHNPQAGQMLSRELVRLSDRDGLATCLVTGMLTTKDPSGYFEPLAGVVERVVAVPIPGSEAGFAAEDLAGIATSCGLDAVATNSVEQAIALLVTHAGSRRLRILICGSLYLVGDVLAINGTPPE